MKVDWWAMERGSQDDRKCGLRIHSWVRPSSDIKLYICRIWVDPNIKLSSWFKRRTSFSWTYNTFKQNRLLQREVITNENGRKNVGKTNCGNEELVFLSAKVIKQVEVEESRGPCRLFPEVVSQISIYQLTYLPWQNFTCPFTYQAMHFGMDTIWRNDVLVS